MKRWLEQIAYAYWVGLTIVVHSLMWLIFGLFIAQIVANLYY